MLASWHDFPVTLDSDALTLEAEIPDEVGNAWRRCPADVEGAIQVDGSHSGGGRSGRLLSVKSHHNAQEPHLPLEFFACIAPQEMQPHAQALPGRQVAVLKLRDQAARVLA